MKKYLFIAVKFIYWLGYVWWTLPQRTKWIEENSKVDTYNIWHSWDKKPAPPKNYRTWSQFWNKNQLSQ